MPEETHQSKNAPLVSVMIPVYNRAGVIGRTIKSVLAQTFKDFELIIIDDYSTDAIAEVIASFDDARIRLVRHTENKGLYPSRNTGIRHARGAFLAFQDSDDVWYPEKLAEEVALLRAAPPKVGGVYSQIEKTYLNGTYIHVPPDGYEPTSGNLMDVFLRGDFFITMQALMIRRECTEQAMFDDTFSLFGDGDFIIQFSKHYELIYNPHIRVTLTVSEDSISRDTRKRVGAREKLFLKEIDLYKRDKNIFALNASRIGKSFESFGEFAKARVYLGMALRARPLDARLVFSYLRTLFSTRR